MRIIGPMTVLLAAVLACGHAGQARAQKPTAASAQTAPAEAPNVVVIAIAAVTQPEGSSGACKVLGQVRQVERGPLFGVGQNVALDVPCRKAGSKARGSADADKLSAAPYGRASLDAKGVLLPGQYQPLDDAPPPPPD